MNEFKESKNYQNDFYDKNYDKRTTTCLFFKLMTQQALTDVFKNSF